LDAEPRVMTADDEESFRRLLRRLDARFANPRPRAEDWSQAWMTTTFRISSEALAENVEQCLASAGYAVSRHPAMRRPHVRVLHPARSLGKVRRLTLAADAGARESSSIRSPRAKP
jgi:hypothetical protein